MRGGWSRAIFGLFAWLAITAGMSAAQQTQLDAAVVHQALDDAWWTGPMLAPSAATLPRGHFLVEPYLYDVIVQGRYDQNGARQSAPSENGFGSLTYMLYGLTNGFTVGLIPTGGYNQVSDGPSSSGIGMGDLTIQGQYRLTQFHEGSRIPAMSFALQETLPTGKYDQLGEHLSDGMGSGAYSTTLAVYSQTYFWLPNHRILRMRLDVSQGFPNEVKLRDASVYGTSAGFRGNAKPGNSLFADLSSEYSVTRRWVLALDTAYRRNGNTRVSGNNILTSTPTPVAFNTGPSDSFALAPAVEYSWKHNIGILLGTRLIVAGHNTAATISPAIAINYVH